MATPSSASEVRTHQILYRDLRLSVERHGLLRMRRLWYLAWGMFLLAGLLAMIAATVRLGNTWWQLGVAMLFGLLLTQFAFLGHDVAHRQAVASRRLSVILGHIIINGLVGASYTWWLGRHSQHHGQPNRVQADPDIQDEIIVNTKPGVAHRRTRLGRLLVRKQGLLFFLLLPLAMIKLHVNGLMSAVHRTAARQRAAETTLIVTRIVGFAAFVASVLPASKALAFIAVESASAGIYLGCCFAPNHIGMPIVPADLPIDFLRRQVMTSRNIRCGPIGDLLMGGLSKQIEHHLFPAMPTPNLSKCAPVVREFCTEHGIPYREQRLLSAYREVISHLNEVGVRGPHLLCQVCPVAESITIA
jgi:fatty acid desaturase